MSDQRAERVPTDYRCICGPMEALRIDGVVVRIACPRCDRQPIDFMEAHDG